MDEMVAELRRESAIQALVPLFFVSGATGLVYQTIWGRQLHLVFGTSTFAIATVLSAFMAGLAIGGWWMAHRADSIAQPLRTYGLLEVGIGLYALVFPYLVDAVQPAYLHVWRAWTPSPVVFGGVQFLLVGSALVLPTAWMGATLPLLARFATNRMGAAGDRVGLLYASNTAGAVFGTWLAGFILLPRLGLSATTWLAAAANLALGAGAIALAGWASGSEAEAQVPPVEQDVVADGALRTVMVVAALAGFASLVYEVAWFRVLGLMLGASVYAFSVMLLAFLIGIAFGGRLGGGWADRLLARGGLPAVLIALAAVELGVGGAAYLTMHAFQELPFWYVWIFDAFRAQEDPTLVWATSLLLAGIVMTPAAVLMGIAFPLMVRAALGGAQGVGDAVGRVYAANTAGGVLGAALAGFVLLPQLTVRGTIQLAVLFNVAAALTAWAARRRELQPLPRDLTAGLAVALAVLTLAVPPRWDPLLMTAGMYKYVTSFKDHSRAGIRNYAVDQYDLLYYKEGLSSVVTVARNQDTKNIWLANNGKVDASTSADMPTQVMVSLLPMQFVDDPSDVLVIGLASGITAGAVTRVDAVKRLDVVELEPAIVGAAQVFAPYNNGLLTDPRTNLILNDGRNHVLLTEPGTYDVIVSEPSNPWLTGVSNLFTAEFFELGKTRLREGGVWSQWVQLYGMDDRDVRTLLATFLATYPHVLMYAAADDADLVLLGSDAPLVPDLAAVGRLFEMPGVAEEFAGISMPDASKVTATLLMDRPHILEILGGAELNTDDNMRIEYRAPLNLHVDTKTENVRLLYRNSWLPVELFVDDLHFLVDLARAYAERDDPDRAVDTLIEAALRLPPASELRAEWLEESLDIYVETHRAEGEVVDTSRRHMFEAIYLEAHVRPILERHAEQ